MVSPPRFALSIVASLAILPACASLVGADFDHLPADDAGGGGDAARRCDRDARAGTYLVTFTREAGTCPDLPQETTQGGATLPAGCTLTGDTWSADDCERFVSGDCGAGSFTAVTVQTTADGGVLDGTETIQMPTCSGTYGVHMVRQ